MRLTRKNLCPFIALTMLFFTAKAQVQQYAVLNTYLEHVNFLLKDGGKWKALNEAYVPTDESSPRYFGYEFIRGIHPNMLHLKVTGYLPVQAEWVIFQDGYYIWDYSRNKLAYHSVYVSGAIAAGESGLIDGKGITVSYSIKLPDGKTEKHREEHVIAGNKLQTSGFISKGNEWILQTKRSWSRLQQPEGKLVFMSTRDGNFEIYSMDAGGGNLRNHSCNKATDYAFSSTPEGKLVFYSNRDGNDEIYLMEADGKKQVNLTRHSAADRIPFSSPDGKKIAFISDRDEPNGEIYVMDADGSNLKRLTDNRYFEDAPTWSPDGKKIYFSRELRDVNDTSGQAVRNSEIFVMDADGGNEIRLTFKDGGDGGPQLSPDGKRIAFYGNDGKGNYEIFLMDADGKNMLNLTEDPMEDYSPSWSPDGKWIAYTKGNSKNYDVWAIHVETKIKFRLTSQPRRDESPFWIHGK